MKNNNKSTVPENFIFTRVSGLIVIKLLSTSFIHLLQNRSIRTSTTWFNQNIYNMAYSVLIVQSEHLQHGIQCSDRSIRTSTTWFNQNIYNMVQSEYLQHGIQCSDFWVQVQKSYSLCPWSQIYFLSCSPSEANIICSHKNITLNRWNYTGILYLNYLNSAE